MPSVSGSFTSYSLVSAGTTYALATLNNLLVLDGTLNTYSGMPTTGGVAVTDTIKAQTISDVVHALATINTIIISFWRIQQPGGSTITDNSIKLIRAGTIEATDHSAGDVFPSSITQKSHPISGIGWTAADINDSGFGVAFSAHIDDTSASGGLAYWDYVAYEIDYTEYVPPVSVTHIDEQYYDGSTYHRANECFCASEGNLIPNPYAGVPGEATDRDISADPILEYTDPLDEINN